MSKIDSIVDRLVTTRALAATASTTEEYLHWACAAEKLQAQLPMVVDEADPRVLARIEAYSENV